MGEDGEEVWEGEWLRFLEPLLGERNLRYVGELVSAGLLRGFGGGGEAVSVGEALGEVVEYYRVLLEETGKTLLSEKIGRLVDEEARLILDTAVENFALETVMEKYYDLLLERIVGQLDERGVQGDSEVEPLSEAVEAAKQSKVEVLSHLAEEIGITISRLSHYLDASYSGRERMTRYEYYRICDILKLPPRNKKVCRVDLLRALLRVKEKLEEEHAAPGTYLNKNDLQKVLTEELRFYQMLEEEALRIYNSGDENANEELKYLKDIIDLNDLKYTLELFVTEPRLLTPILGREEKEKLVKAAGKTVKKYEKHLERAVEILLNKKQTINYPRINELSNSEVRYILDAAVNWRKRQLGILQSEDVELKKFGKQGFLTQLAKGIGLPISTLRNYIDRTDNKYRMTRMIYLKICDVLNLPQNARENKRVGREDLLQALLTTVNEFKEEQKAYLEADNETKGNVEEYEDLATLHWFEQPPGICCIFHNEDLQRVFQKALERFKTVAELTKRIREIGPKVGRETVRRIKEKNKLDVELVLALIGVLIDRRPDEVRKLVREGKLAQVFKSSLEEQGLAREEDSEWLHNLPLEIVRELGFENLAKEVLGQITVKEKMITPKTAQKLLKHLANQGLGEKEFRVKLPEEAWRELRDAIKKMKSSEERILIPEELKRLRKERGLSQRKLAEKVGVSQSYINYIEKGLKKSKLLTQQKILNILKGEEQEKTELREENLCIYAARKVKEYIGKEFSDEIINEAIYTREHRISIKHYLILCEVFGIEPNLSLHYRENRIRQHLERVRSEHPRVFEIDFLSPIVYKNPMGMTVEIHENEKDIFVVINGKWLKAEKKKTRYGGEWCGLTIIDYVTEEGVFTLIKEAGELWPPLLTPWFSAPLDWDIGFKTSQTLKELVQKIKEALPQLKQVDLTKITGINRKTLVKLETGKTNTILLRHLLLLIALKSTLNQTDIKSEICKYENEIDAIEGRKLSEKRENIIYINLKTPFGAGIIGHTFGDANLYRMDERRIRFEYVNTEHSNVEEVNELLKNYGAEGTICKIKGRGKDSKNRKDVYKVSTGGLLAYALYRAVPKAVGDKTKNNPKAPSEIIKNPILAYFFAKALIKDEAHVSPKKGSTRIDIHVSIEKKVEESQKQKIQEIADEQVKELEKEKGRELTSEQKLAARHVAVDKVSKEIVKLAKRVPCQVLLSLKEALKTLGINPIEKGIQHFYPSEKGGLTACWRIYLSKDNTKRAYTLGLITGIKKKNYESFRRITSRIRLVNPVENVEKLSKEQVVKLREKLEEYRKKIEKKINGIPYSNIEADSNLRKITVIINQNKPEDIEKKRIELEKKGITTEPKPTFVYIGTKIISAEWELKWFEP